ncbi:beta-ketoacyl synthase N-terminal-like domain-containing protein [Desulforhopalus singaporensis]|uniref:3-oxoacyl-[acyl-carrier-protein] synthase-1 n=1 Tax=Desulforhopalus singaporensis TaxID=91360 RepID=A0A1H0T5D2_9BACT|nr:beta-ketoacyl synthase N-terminal-like domain-containing protein [Desulforhopalus singaporensis]SDP49253.1 3-oxoacyl-[acyl-carrier-protein] synthase-1 [Desulforhopalus singaporensis]
MTRRVMVAAGNILTPLGDLQQTWNGLLAGKRGLDVQQFQSSMDPLPLGVIDGLEGSFGSWLRLRSMLDRLLADVPMLTGKTALFCATTKAAIDEPVDPVLDMQLTGQPWQVGDYLARKMGLQEPVTVSAACVSGLIAVIRGAMDIRSGKVDHALIVGFDLLSHFVVTGFSSLKSLSPTGARPFDCNRDGLSLGDGGGWMLLSAEDALLDSGDNPVYADSWAIACDAVHITAPSRTGVGLLSVLQQIMADNPPDIGGINGHGTATVYNDAMELVAFNKTMPPHTPLCSVKGSLGHSLGAAGIVEALLAVQSIQEMVLPPTVGLVKGEKTICRLSGTSPLPLAAPSVLTCNSGFGGINGGLLFRC